MTVYLPKGALITADEITLSDHNRSAASLSPEAIKSDYRTMAGYLKRQVTSSKRTLQVSWENLPALDSQTVDGYAGRNTIAENVRTVWAADTRTPITVSWYEVGADNVQTLVSMSAFLDSYKESLNKRWGRQFWNVDISFVEV